MAISITFSDKQYQALISALAVGHPNKNVNKHKSELISKLPSSMSKRITSLRDVIDDPNLLTKTANAHDLIQRLVVMDTAKQASKYTGRKVVLMLADVFKKDPVLAKNTRDLVFDKNPAYTFPGQLVKHILAESLVESGYTNDRMIKEYKTKILGNYPGNQTVRIFEKMLGSNPKWSRDIDLLTRLGSQNNTRVAMIAVSIADDKILPYLVSITNKAAREAIKRRLNA